MCTYALWREVCYKDIGSKAGSTAKEANRRSKHPDTHACGTHHAQKTHHRRNKRHRPADRQAHTHTPIHARTNPTALSLVHTHQHNRQHHNARRRTTGPRPPHCCLRPPILAARLPGAALAPNPTPTPQATAHHTSPAHRRAAPPAHAAPYPGQCIAQAVSAVPAHANEGIPHAHRTRPSWSQRPSVGGVKRAGLPRGTPPLRPDGLSAARVMMIVSLMYQTRALCLRRRCLVRARQHWLTEPHHSPR